MQPQLHDQDRDMTPEHEISDPPVTHEHRYDEENRQPLPNQSQALQRVECQTIVDTQQPREVTPQQARNESIATMLDAAYQKASTLQLTPEEAKELAADFPDEAFELGAGGDQNLLFLSHVYLRQRLNQVLGVGAAVPIRRREWSEEFTYFKDRQEKHAARVYVEMVLIVRGCVVGEAIADAIYYKGNGQDSYADTLEKAKSNAFRRCCKEFGVGLQPWMKGFCEEWKQRNRQNRSGGRQNAPQQQTTQAPRPAPKTAPQPNVERPAATTASVLPGKATEKTRDWAFGQLVNEFGVIGLGDFFLSKGWVKVGDEIDKAWPLEYVPTSRQELVALADEIRKAAPEPTAEPSTAADTDLPPEIAECVITIPRRGMKKADYMNAPDTIGSLYAAMKGGDVDAQKRLWGLVKGWTPEPYVDGNNKKWPIKPEDAQCRIDLDTFLAWYEDNGGTDQT